MTGEPRPCETVFVVSMHNAIETRSISDGLSATELMLYVYDENGNLLPELTVINEDAFVAQSASVSLSLLEGMTYNFVFVALNPAAANTAYVIDPQNKTLSVDYSALTANDDTYDFFTASLQDYQAVDNSTQSVSLARPFAQVNAGASAEDVAVAQDNGALMDGITSSFTFSSVGTEYDLMGGCVTANEADVTIPAGLRPVGESLIVGEDTFEYIAMAYVLVPQDAFPDDNHSFLDDVILDINLTTQQGGDGTIHHNLYNVPIQRNHRTNIIGNLFSSNQNFIINVDEGFDNNTIPGGGEALEMLRFCLSDGVNTYEAFDISNGFVNVQVPNGTDMSAMTAGFEFNGSYVTVDGVRQHSGVGTHDFSDFTAPLTYSIVNTVGDTLSYTVRMFDLPVVILTSPSPIVSKDEWTEDCSMVLREADAVTVTDYGSQVQLKGRGNTTWTFPKKPYAIKLNKKAKVLGMPKHKRWVLLANWLDKTLLRNAFAFEIARATDLAWTPRGGFVEVILNGEHVGNYYLCEQIKVDGNRVNITEMSATDIEGDALTGGYLMEIDVNFDETNKFRSAVRNLPYNIKEPDEDVLQDQQFGYIQSYISEMENALDADDWLETREYTNYMDTASFADFWFVNELAKNYELTHPKSCYVHKDRLGKLTAGPVWDFDYGTFKPASSGNGNYFSVKGAVYYDRLFLDPQFISVVKRHWSEHLEALEAVSDYVTDLAGQIERSAERNALMWPIDEVNGAVNGDTELSVDAAVTRIVNFYTSKVAWMTGAINAMEGYVPPEPETPVEEDINPGYGTGWDDESW